MSRLRGWIARVGGLFHKQRQDRDLEQELESHIQMSTEDHLKKGASREQARRRAILTLGGIESTKESYRDQRGLPFLETFLQDIRFGARQLRRNPGFAAVAVITLALGIGANTAIFSVVDAVLLRPLGYPDSGRLVALCERGPDWSGGSIAYPNFTDWNKQQSVFEQFGIYSGANFTLTSSGEPVRLAAAIVSSDVFTALRTAPEKGRVFREDEDKAGAPAVAVISHALWENRFGGDAEILDKTIGLNGKAYAILGVMPPGFEFPYPVDVWVPMGPYAAEASWQKRDNHPGLFGLARLRSGVTVEQARADLEVIALRLEQQYPDSNKSRRVQIDRLLDKQVGNVRRALWVLFGAVSFVLVIACANVANLLLARAAVREKEMSLRAALGAGRWRITRQLLAESVLLALLGMAAGLLFAKGALRVLTTVAAANLPRAAEIRLDPRVLLFSGVVAVATGILFGLAPAWQARRLNLHGTLKETGRGNTIGRAGLRQGLVVVEVALTFVLLAGAGLLLRSFEGLLHVNPGFVPERVLTFRVNPPENKYRTDEQQIQFYHALLDKLQALPGVQAASLASQNSIPLHEGGWDMRFLIEGRPEPPSYLQPSLQVHLVAPAYFQVMGIPLLRGRDFTEQDNREHLDPASSGKDWGVALNSIIIDEDFAKRYWPNQNPLGQRVRLPWGDRNKQPLMTIVGVVGRIKENHLNEQGGLVQAYFPIYQQPLRNLAAVVKATSEPATLLASLRTRISQLDPTLPIFDITTMKEMRERNVASDKLNLGLLGAFAGLALSLAVIGLYGLLSYTVTQRQREIGVRMALGAQPFEVLRFVVGSGMRLTFIGVLLGLVGALAITRVLVGVLFNVKPTDPLTFAAVTLSLCIAALLACYIPARRATKVNPMEALRFE